MNACPTFLADGTQTSVLVAKDQDGLQINCDGVKDRWHDRHIDLSAYAGKTLSFTLLIDDVCLGGDHFDIYFNDVAIAGAGTVSAIYSSQAGTISVL